MEKHEAFARQALVQSLAPKEVLAVSLGHAMAVERIDVLAQHAVAAKVVTVELAVALDLEEFVVSVVAVVLAPVASAAAAMLARPAAALLRVRVVFDSFADGVQPDCYYSE